MNSSCNILMYTQIRNQKYKNTSLKYKVNYFRKTIAIHMVKKWNRIFKITLTRRHSGCCDLDLPLMSSAMFEAAFASQQLSHRRATDFRKKKLSVLLFHSLLSLSKFYQGLQQCRPSYCMAYHPKPLDAAPGGAARGLSIRKMNDILQNCPRCARLVS